MITENTVFIIGAGGSYPYGFPLGIKLRELAYSKSSTMFQNFHNHIGGDFLTEVNNLAYKFSRHFKASGDQSIDWFLKKFPEYSVVGKFLINDIILQAENDSKFLEEIRPEFKNQDWYWYLYNEMSKYPKGETNPALFLNNKVKFITFNYDRSLEQFLFATFSNGHNFTKYGTTAIKIFKEIPILHVYGKAAKLDWEREAEEYFIGYKGYQPSYNTLERLQENIKLIDEREAKKNTQFGNFIMQAERIFFLGFSYADENLHILDIPEIITKEQYIYGTAFGMTENEIGKIKAKFKPKADAGKLKIVNTDCLGLLREYL